MVGEHYTIVTKDNCPWCTKAKVLLDFWGKTYQEINLYENQWAREIFKKEGYKTVPQIWNGPIHIGGYSDLDNYLAGD